MLKPAIFVFATAFAAFGVPPAYAAEGDAQFDAKEVSDERRDVREENLDNHHDPREVRREQRERNPNRRDAKRDRRNADTTRS